MTIGGTTKTTTLTYDSDDELNSTSSSTGGFVNSYTYNANGEQTGRTLSGTAYTLAYDYEGQLTGITQGSNTTSFVYDGLGRRYSRTAGGTTTTAQFDGGATLVEKQGSTTTMSYAYGNAETHSSGSSSETPQYDGLGSQRAVTNSSQSVTGTQNYDAFGNAIGSSGSTSSPFGYGATSGYRADGDAGLLLVGARYYDAQVGRFITRDTYLDQHPYLYCNHDPVNYKDPTGHDIVDRWNGLPAPVKGAIVGGVIAVGLALLFPAAAATCLGSVAIGAAAGIGGALAGGASDNTTIGAAAVGGGVMSGWSGAGAAPWIQSAARWLRVAIIDLTR